MGDETNAFYVVRKGEAVGVYKSISDLQSFLRSTVNDPSVVVQKGFGLSEEAEEYLSSRGLENATYYIEASNVQAPIFGQLVTCTVREPNSSETRPQEYNVGSTSKKNHFLHVPRISSVCSSCIVEFDGASNVNLGRAGAGAVVKAADGSMVFQLREGLGNVTVDVAEYRGAILGMKYALQNGFTRIRVQGSSNIVCKQVDGQWKTTTPKMADLYREVKELKDQFLSFQICQVEKNQNTDADAQANQGVLLNEGQCQVEYEVK